jgi:hypothetical protein
MNRWRSLWPVLLILLVSAFPFAGPLARGEALGPWDQIASMVPGGEAAADRPWDVLQADGALQFHVWRDLLFEKIRTGEGAGWNRYALLGTPFAANGQTGTEYPLHLILAYSGLATSVAVILLAWLHLAWTGLGVYVVARVLGGLRLTSTLAAVAVVGSTWMLGWTVLSSVPTTVSWIPWVLVAMLWRPPATKAHVVTAWSLRILAPLMLVAGGHLQFIAYGIVAALVVGLVCFIKVPNQRLAVVCVLGVAMVGAYFQSAPSRQFAQSSHRANVASEEGFQAYLRGAYPPAYWSGLLLPSSLGDPQKWMEVDGQRIGGFLPALTHPGSNLAELGFGMGPVLLAMLFALKRRSDFGLAWAVGGGLTVAGLLLSLPTPVLRWLYFGVPGWSASGSPARAGILVLLGLAILVGACARPSEAGIVTDGESKNAIPRALVIALGGMVFVFFAVALLSPVEPMAVLPELLAFLILAGTLVFARRGVPAGAVGLAVAAGVGLLGPAHVPSGKVPVIPADAAQGRERTASVNDRWSLFQTPKAVLPPNLLTLGRTRDAGGYDSLVDAQTVRTIAEANGGAASPPENGNMMFVRSSVDRDALAEMNVGRLVWADRTETIAAKPYAELNGRPVDVVWERDDRVRIPVTGGGQLTLRERNLKGWSVVSGGGALDPQEFWIKTTVPADSREVVLHYRTPAAEFWPVLAALRWFALMSALFAAVAALMTTNSVEKAEDS